MNLCSRFFMVLTIFITGNGQQIKNDLNTGIVFLLDRTFILSGNSWTLTLDIDLDRYRITINDLYEHINKFVENQWLSDHQDILASHVKAEGSEALITLQELDDEIQAFKGEPEQSLLPAGGRRGLFDFIGLGLHFLTGTAVNSQVTDLHKKINAIGEIQKDIHHDLLQQISIVKNMHSFENESREIIKNIVNVTGNIEKQFTAFENRLANDTAFRLNSLNKFLNLSFLMKQVHLQISKLQDKIFHLKLAFYSAVNGQLTEFIIPQKVLLQNLQDIENKLPPRFQMVLPLNIHDISKYYNFLTAQAVVANNTVRVFIHIPLKTQDRTFNLYKIEPLPVNIRNTNFSAYIKPPYPYVAISTDKETYLPLYAEDLKTCTEKVVNICPNNIPIRTIQPKTCLGALITNSTQNVVHYCERIITARDRSASFYKPENSQYWIYSVPKTINANLKCYDRGEIIGLPRNLSGNHYISIPKDCSLVSDSFRLDSTEQYASKISADKESHFIPDLNYFIHEVDLSFLKTTSQDKTLQTEMLELVKNTKNLDKTFPNGMEINKLMTHLEGLMEPTASFTYKTRYWQIFLFIILITMCVIVLGYVWHMSTRQYTSNGRRIVNYESAEQELQVLSPRLNSATEEINPTN